MAERGSAFDRSVEAMRATSRWTLAAFAAVGTVLVAGSQLSTIGRFEVNEPRLWVAVAALAVVLGIAGLAVWFVIAVETAGETSLSDLAWEEEHQSSADAKFLRANAALLGGFPSARALDAAYRAAIQARYDAIVAGSQDDIDAAQRWVMYLGDVVIFPLLSALRYHRVRCTFDRWAGRIVILGVIAGLAVGAFTWAANPMTKEETVMITDGGIGS